MSYPLQKALLLTRKRTEKCIKRALPPSRNEIAAQAYLERGAALWDALTELHPQEAAKFASAIDIAALLQEKS